MSELAASSRLTLRDGSRQLPDIIVLAAAISRGA
jgi:hypothetical protein